MAYFSRSLKRPLLGAAALNACWSLAFLVLTPVLERAQTGVSPPVHREPGYVNPQACAACHQSIWQTYQRTAMARSFRRASAVEALEDFTTNNTFHHAPSESYFTMLKRGGELFQRRYQLDSGGKPINVMEKRVDFIIGSGNHSRAYLNRTGLNTLIELPLAWYSEKGGYWAMNPGYDRPDHDGFRRTITYDCMFCHNGYPEIPKANNRAFSEPVYTGSLPEGIDCQRCHGPGARHVQLAGAGASRVEVRRAIVNPARLTPERQMEVCMQCHLETTSFPLPGAIQRCERGPFSYRPGEPLSSFILFFDHAPGKGRDEKFEFVSAAYRLRRSACFRQSNGKMTCTTCHNPHDIPRGEAAVRHYDAVCRECHDSAVARLIAGGNHPGSGSCIDCHMPKRRTEDVVHAVVTDHYIQRRKPGRDLTADIPERHETGADAYRGPVVTYYPAPLPHSAANDLYLAAAQVIQQSNLKEGIAQLTAAVQRYAPQGPEFYLQLAEAWRNDGHPDRALAFYQQAVRRDPQLVFALQQLGSALRRSGRDGDADGVLRRAASEAPGNPVTWRELGLTWEGQGKRAEAIAALGKAVQLDPDMAEAHNNLGVIRLAGGDRALAESSFREAIRIQPDYADAHVNLANLLLRSGDLAGARPHFEIALRFRPRDAATHYGYALLLGRMRDFDGAQRELEESLRCDPRFAGAHQLLGDLLMAKDQAGLAIPHYREAVRLEPGSARAQLSLGAALAKAGDTQEALSWLEKAATGSDATVRQQAKDLLREMGR